MRRIATIGILLPAAVFTAAGCATKDWVKDLVGKKEVEIDQRFTGVEKRAADEGQRVEGMGFRLKTLENGLEETGGVARGARERADAAHARADDAYTRADAVEGRLSRLWNNRHQRDLVETLEVRFAFDKWDLNDAAQTSLAALVKELRENPRLTVDLEGYADPAGTYDYNVALSQRRVEAVRRFLVEQGIELPRIHAVGLGPIAASGQPGEKKRRVTLRLMVQPD
jgi:outer membrane protein OmpA-like peptidoglycan-associated protein